MAEPAARDARRRMQSDEPLADRRCPISSRRDRRPVQNPQPSVSREPVFPLCLFYIYIYQPLFLCFCFCCCFCLCFWALNLFDYLGGRSSSRQIETHFRTPNCSWSSGRVTERSWTMTERSRRAVLLAERRTEAN